MIQSCQESGRLDESIIRVSSKENRNAGCSNQRNERKEYILTTATECSGTEGK